MSKKTVITGATSGVGKATAIALARHGHELFLVGRSQQKLHDTQKEIKKALPQTVIHAVVADFCNLASVHSAAQEIATLTDYIDVLINNAGGIFNSFYRTTDGLEEAFQVNHLSPFLFTKKLLPLLEKSEESRIISVSSEAHKMGKIDFDDLSAAKNFSGWRQYGATKMMNVLFAFRLHQLYQQKGISSFALHPGVVRTKFGANNGGYLSLFSWLPFLKTPEQGAETSIFLATESIENLQSGRYYKDKKVASTHPKTRDLTYQETLWVRSESLLKQKGFL